MESVETPEEEFSHWYDEELHRPIDPEEYCAALVNEMGLERDDVFKAGGEVHKVHTVDTMSGSVVVNDPTCDNPQDARAGSWEVSILDLYQDWRQGKTVPATVKVVADA